MDRLNIKNVYFKKMLYVKIGPWKSSIKVIMDFWLKTPLFAKT
jgi:hypothetical protein